jgi:hypothetical protein
MSCEKYSRCLYYPESSPSRARASNNRALGNQKRSFKRRKPLGLGCQEALSYTKCSVDMGRKERQDWRRPLQSKRLYTSKRCTIAGDLTDCIEYRTRYVANLVQNDCIEIETSRAPRRFPFPSLAAGCCLRCPRANRRTAFCCACGAIAATRCTGAAHIDIGVTI